MVTYLSGIGASFVFEDAVRVTPIPTSRRMKSKFQLFRPIMVSLVQKVKMLKFFQIKLANITKSHLIKMRA